jgi:outer membrane protein OmpA-like peptidoglycan-associated protein
MMKGLLLAAGLLALPMTAGAVDCNASRLTAPAPADGDAVVYYQRGISALEHDDFDGADAFFRSSYAAAGRITPVQTADQTLRASVARLVETSLQQAGGQPGPALTTAYFRLRALRDLAKGKAIEPWIEQVMVEADNATVAVPEEAATVATLKECRGFGIAPKFDVRVLFDFDSSVVSQVGQAQLSRVASSLLAARVNQVLVLGHTDKHGTDAYNLALSQRRAEAAVVALLSAEPRLAGKLKAQGRGRTQLLYQGDGESFDRLNRRVELILDDQAAGG